MKSNKCLKCGYLFENETDIICPYCASTREEVNPHNNNFQHQQPNTYYTQQQPYQNSGYNPYQQSYQPYTPIYAPIYQNKKSGPEIAAIVIAICAIVFLAFILFIPIIVNKSQQTYEYEDYDEYETDDYVFCETTLNSQIVDYDFVISYTGVTTVQDELEGVAAPLGKQFVIISYTVTNSTSNDISFYPDIVLYTDNQDISPLDKYPEISIQSSLPMMLKANSEYSGAFVFAVDEGITELNLSHYSYDLYNNVTEYIILDILK